MAAIIRIFAGALGFLLSALSAVVLFGLEIGINPSLLVLSGGFCLTLWSLLARGCKNPPYWLTLIAAVVLVLLSLNDALNSGLDAALALAGLRPHALH